MVFSQLAECKHRVKRHDKKSDSSAEKNQVDKVLKLVKEDKILEFIKRNDKDGKDKKDVAKDKSPNKEADDSSKVRIKFFIRFYNTFFYSKLKKRIRPKSTPSIKKKIPIIIVIPKSTMNLWIVRARRCISSRVVVFIIPFIIISFSVLVI